MSSALAHHAQLPAADGTGATADFLDDLSGIGLHSYLAMRDPELPGYKDWRDGYFARDGSNYVSREGEAYTNDELKQAHQVLSHQAGNPLISNLFIGPKFQTADYLVWRNQNFSDDGGPWQDDEGNIYSEPALQEMFGSKSATQLSASGETEDETAGPGNESPGLPAREPQPPLTNQPVASDSFDQGDPDADLKITDPVIGAERRRKPSTNYPTENDGVSAEDLASGNYIRVGFRHLLPHNPSKFAYHAYVQIPTVQDGKAVITKDGPQLDSYGVLGNEGGNKNQQIRKNDWRNDQLEGREGKVVLVRVTPEQREALRERMEYFSQHEGDNYAHPCPVCGPNYHTLTQSSNTFVYNMLFWNPAGMIWAPKPPDNKILIHPTPKYKENLGSEGWYE